MFVLNIGFLCPYLGIILTSITCSILGNFLILQKKSMLVDAISHSILLGIVISVLFTKDLSSPWLIIGATVTGILTSYLSELLSNNEKINEDASIGITFSLFFAIAIIVIGINLGGIKNAHVDIDAAILGDPNLLTFDKNIRILGILILNILFITFFYKELKINSFDKAFTASLGFSTFFLNYMLITLISLTSVITFDAVGVILVIALMIGPAATTLLFTKNLCHSILISILISFLSAHLGYCISILTDLPSSSLTAFIVFIFFLLVFFFEPTQGIILKFFHHRSRKKDFIVINLLIHLENNEKKNKINYLNQIIQDLKNYSLNYEKYIKKALEKKYIIIQNQKIFLTILGKEILQEKKDYWLK
ncbi:metal ABC transporter permease [Candidatus Phytoplasma pini]|uniref:metal ABC transporter permease n=1 Tax=Candidatus Phytoplasma pini TaxID=267362 RepID=UPI0011A0530D|nr:metal ABC transporter permease [Candidatus Phytoplasma pini]